MHNRLYTEVLANDSLREVFYTALITGNIINAVSTSTPILAVYIVMVVGWTSWRCIWIQGQLSAQTERHKVKYSTSFSTTLHLDGKIIPHTSIALL